MYRKFLRSKIHRATVTQADLDYEGSLTLPPDLMRASDIAAYEAVCVWNVTRGTRLETYAIEGIEGSRDICANGQPPMAFVQAISSSWPRLTSCWPTR